MPNYLLTYYSAVYDAIDSALNDTDECVANSDSPDREAVSKKEAIGEVASHIDCIIQTLSLLKISIMEGKRK